MGFIITIFLLRNRVVIPNSIRVAQNIILLLSNNNIDICSFFTFIFTIVIFSKQIAVYLKRIFETRCKIARHWWSALSCLRKMQFIFIHTLPNIHFIIFSVILNDIIWWVVRYIFVYFLIYLINFAKLAGVGMPDFSEKGWLADIALRYELKRGKTCLTENVISAP